MTDYFEDILADDSDPEVGQERNDLERDRDTLTDLLITAHETRAKVFELDSMASGLVLDHFELGEDEATSELPGLTSPAAELVGEAVEAVEYLLRQATDRLNALDEAEAAYASKEDN